MEPSPAAAPTEGKRRRVTVRDVAQDANVSRATVSLVLRGSPLVAASTRERVLASARKLRYVYHRQAASLRSSHSNSVGLIMTDLANPFFAELTVGVEEVLNQANYVCLLGQNSDDLAKQKRLIRTMQEHGADGIILSPAQGTTPDVILGLQDANMPVALVARYVPGIEADYVGFDNLRGTRQATQHLIEHGHRRIAFAGGSPFSAARQERLEGVRSALAAIGLTMPMELAISGAVTRQAGFEAIHRLMALPDRPTAVVCYNDVVAFGALLGLRAIGLEPGRDCAVVGFDDVEEAALQRPPLTTVGTNPIEMGRRVAELLLSRIADQDRPVARVVEPPQLRVRGSCGHEVALADARIARA